MTYNYTWRIENGEWVGYLDKPKPARGEKSKTQTASQTVPKLTKSNSKNPRSPASGHSKYNWLYDLKVIWRALGSPWYTLLLATLLGVSLALNVSYYLDNINI